MFTDPALMASIAALCAFVSVLAAVFVWAAWCDAAAMAAAAESDADTATAAKNAALAAAERAKEYAWSADLSALVAASPTAAGQAEARPPQWDDETIDVYRPDPAPSTDDAPTEEFADVALEPWSEEYGNPVG